VAPSAPARRILVVDDDEGLLILMAETLRGEGHEVTTADSAKTAREALDRRKPDLMVLDLKLQDGSGPALVAELQQHQTRVPFIVVTGQGDEKVAVEVMKQGALDYVIKDTRMLDLLPAVVQRALAAVAQEQALAAAQTEHKRLEREILAVSERERHSIGADLHDNLGQQLTALELMCTALKEDAAGHAHLTKGLERMGRMLREAVAQTRALARGLVPVGSDPEALQNGLTELVARISAVGRVRCRFECPEPVTIGDPFVAGHLYRIAQEAVNNALKHAHANEVVVRLTRTKSQLLLEIIDDGAGMSKAHGAGTGVGLGVMQHRAGEIGAELSVSSKRGSGVIVCCALPVKS
jgi:signal transduction histidine kinase